MPNVPTITQIFVPDQDQALDFYVGKLGFEVTNDMAFGAMRWLTVALPGQPDRQVLLEKPGSAMVSHRIGPKAMSLVTSNPSLPT